MANLKRYYFNSEGMRLDCAQGEYQKGEWVKFDDIKELLNTDTQHSNGAKPAEICPHCGGYGVAKRECGSKQCQYCERWW